MSSVNKVLILGRLGKDPETRQTQNGAKIVNLSVATSERWKDKNTGEKRERTEWHKVVIFNEHLADIAEKYLSKGSQVFLEGSLQTRKWQTQDGQDRYSTEIVLQRFKGEIVLLGGGSEREDSGADYGAPDRQQNLGPSDDLDDEIPF